MARDILRRVRFAPYCRGMGPRFALTLWDTGRLRSDGKPQLGYRLRMLRDRGRLRSAAPIVVTLFEGEDFGCSPLHSVDSDATVAAVMGFLTLRPGDTDPDYFADYTPEQRAYCEEHAEALAAEVAVRFGEGA